MIRLSVNKKEMELMEAVTVEKLLIDRGSTRAAVWINGVQLLKSEYPTRIVGEGDDIKILRLSSGG